jgi:predicted N-acetyltransferase YhbS
LVIRQITREEIERIWDEIDRSEVIEGIYYLRDGELTLEREQYDMRGWAPGEREQYTPILCDCFDRGGTFYGAFEDGRMVGAAVLESRFIGRRRDQLQLKFLHVSSDCRKQGLGRALFDRAVARADELGARRLYISATPSDNTIDFYRHLGCTVTEEVDQELFALEPEDIHLEYAIP